MSLRSNEREVTGRGGDGGGYKESEIKRPKKNYICSIIMLSGRVVVR